MLAEDQNQAGIGPAIRNTLIQCAKVVMQFYGAVSVAVSIILEGSEEAGCGLQLGICICTAVTPLQLELE